MRMLTVDGERQVRWREVPDAAVEEPGDAVVRPLAVARCDLDGPMVLGLLDYVGVEGRPHGCGLGHELCGEVVEVGADVTTVAPGDRVIVPFQISCGCCERCRAGFTAACRSVPFGSAYGLGPFTGHEWGGALADRVRVPFADRMLLALPDGVDPVVAAGIPDNLADGYRCVAAALDRWPGGDVLVSGGLAPSVGLYAAAWAVALGAGRVVFADSDPGRLAIADRFGARVHDRGDGSSVAEAAAGARFVATVDAGPDGLADLLRATAAGGICTSVWGPPEGRLPLASMYVAGVTYEISRVNARALAPVVLDLVASGRFDPSVVPVTRVAMADAADHLLDPDPKVVFTA